MSTTVSTAAGGSVGRAAGAPAWRRRRSPSRRRTRRGAGDLAGAGSTPLGRSTATTSDVVGHRVDQRPRPRGRRPGRPPMPERCRRATTSASAPAAARGPPAAGAATTRPPAALSAASPAACGVLRPSEHRVDARARARRARRRRTARRRRCRPAPDEQHDRRAVAPLAQPDGDDGGERRARPAASAVALGQPRHRGRLGGADLLDGVGLDHGATASALGDDDGRGDAGVVGERQVDAATPSSSARAARCRATSGAGGRRRPRRTSASCQCSPPGRRAPWPAPPWPRTGRRARRAARSRSVVGEQPLAQPRRALAGSPRSGRRRPRRCRRRRSRRRRSTRP